MGYRIQGVIVRAKPDSAGLTALEQIYGYRLFELVGRGLWVLDFAIAEPTPGDGALIRAARPLAPGYVDALRVLGQDEEKFEQLAWLAAAAVVARQLRQPVFGFLSDNELLDFATIVTPDGVGVIGDKLGNYLLRWEGGTLAIQPFCQEGTDGEPPVPPEELSMIPAMQLLPNETLARGGYPLHGNVLAEMNGFADAAGWLGLGTRTFGPTGSLALLEARGLDHSLWDRAAGGSRARKR